MRIPFTNFQIKKESLNIGNNSPHHKIAEFPIGSTAITKQQANLPIFESTLEAISKQFSLTNVEYFDKDYKDIRNELAYRLKVRPNDDQTPSEFWYCFAYNLYKFQNSIIIPTYKSGKLTSLDVVDMSINSLSWVEDSNGDKVLSVFDSRKQSYSYVYASDIVHVRLKPNQIFNGEQGLFYANDIPSIINENLSILLTEAKLNFDIQGVFQIGSSNTSNFGGGTQLSEKEKESRLSKIFRRVKSKILVIDDTEKWTPVKSEMIKQKVEDIERLRNMYFESYGIPPGIVNGKYTFEEYTTFRNDVVNPKLRDLEQELSYKFVGPSRLIRGDQLHLRIPIFAGMSFKDLSLYFDKAIYQGYMSQNDILNIMGQKPISDGDEYTGNKNMATLNNTSGEGEPRGNRRNKKRDDD